MKIIPGEKAWDNLLRGNAFSRWNTAPQNPGFAATANGRLSSGIFVAEYGVDAIQMKPGDKVFCMGSCFARNVELALRHCGIGVVDGMVGDSMFNLYNTQSMENELRWALDPAFPYNESFVLKGADGFADPHTSSTGAFDDLERCMAVRRRIIDATRQIVGADFVIVTLGLAEAWFDKRLRIYLNVTPPRAIVQGEPGRFELHQLDYTQNMAALERIVALIERHCAAATRIILTVSPVPFQATFSEDDVVVANTYSKSVLRTVAQDYAGKNSRVKYIPIYDSIANTNPDAAWEPDRIHVDSEIVLLNISNLFPRSSPTAIKDAKPQIACGRSSRV